MQDLSSDFEKDYLNVLGQLSEKNAQDNAIRALNFAEEARVNSSSDEYAPEWLQPYGAIASALALRDLNEPYDKLKRLVGAAILRAAQLGYTEGYFAGKDD